jgi:hypothetical protein
MQPCYVGTCYYVVTRPGFAYGGDGLQMCRIKVKLSLLNQAQRHENLRSGEGIEPRILNLGTL